MAEYLSEYTGKRVDSAVGIIPSGKPDNDSVIVVGSTGLSSYKPLSQIKGTEVEANSSTSATQDLSKLTVGTTTYNLAIKSAVLNGTVLTLTI